MWILLRQSHFPHLPAVLQKARNPVPVRWPVGEALMLWPPHPRLEIQEGHALQAPLCLEVSCGASMHRIVPATAPGPQHNKLRQVSELLFRPPPPSPVLTPRLGMRVFNWCEDRVANQAPIWQHPPHFQPLPATPSGLQTPRPQAVWSDRCQSWLVAGTIVFACLNHLCQSPRFAYSLPFLWL